MIYFDYHSSTIGRFVLILCELIEDLFDGGLFDGVLLDAVIVPLSLEEVEQLSDIWFSLYLYPDECLQCLQDLGLSEYLSDVARCLVSDIGYFQVLDNKLNLNLLFS